MNHFDLTYVVEDDPITATITKILLESVLPGGRVQTYANGQQALDRLTAALREGTGEVPDLILLDLNMPLLDGWEFLDILNGLSLPRAVCILVLTSSINAEDRAKAARYPNVAGYFAKPLDVGGVVRVLRLRRKASGPAPLLAEFSRGSLHHLVYQSGITTPLGESELLLLLTQSRAFNAAHGLTGVLLYNEREFLQLLEGPKAHVHAVFARIARDPRHTTVVKLADGPILHRQFTQWAMGFQAVQSVDFAHFIGYATSGIEKQVGIDSAWPDSALHILLATFVSGYAHSPDV
jgi:CheY-like chemotaxis protein